MALKFSYGSLTPDKINGFFGPNLALAGDPAIDQPAMRAAGFAGGRIATIVAATFAGHVPGASALTPLDGGSTKKAFGAFVNGGGNYAESLGVSGSRKMSVARCKVMFDVVNEIVNPPAYVATPTTPYGAGNPLYCGCANKSTVGQWTADAPVDGAGAAITNPEVCGICLHAPTVTEPYLGVATTF